GTSVSSSFLGFCLEASKSPKATESPAVTPESTSDIPEYQSAATPTSPSEPVGPGASKSGDYPNTEYFCYDKMSYFDLEVEMGNDRLAQPSADNGNF
ncbi:uncharacterized protein LOC121865786, partial [Homarus americanus]|uniref:uncharacterized protein LOC121865786 n=1 Tax=Homarus americanus TaxID=6706 RepID=UPI001C459FAB